MIRSNMAVIGGFLTTLFLAFATDFALTALIPGRSGSDSVQLQIDTLLYTELYTELYAANGGYVTGRIARAMTPVYVLAAIAFLLTAVTLFLAPSSLPTCYKAVSILLLVPVTWLGGWLATTQERNLGIDKRYGLRP